MTANKKRRSVKRSEDDRADSHRGELPTGILGGGSHPGELPATLARIHNVVQEEEAQHHQGGGVGQSSGPVSGRGLRCRRRVGPFPPSRVEGLAGSSKDSAGFEGVAQTEPSLLLLSYMLYLRPGEFAKIRVCDVVRPVPRGGPLYQH